MPKIQKAFPLPRHLMVTAGLAAVIAMAAPAAKAADETHLYWGDLHLHTNYSIDAYSTGNKNVTPDDAYRYARGLPIIGPDGKREVKIRRPLDFMAVTDHAIMLGSEVWLERSDPLFSTTEWGRKLLEIHGDPKRSIMGLQMGMKPDEKKEMMDQVFSPKIRQATWAGEVDAAEKNNIPGKFTSLIAWEYTIMTGANNMHRNVISNATGEAARKFYPLSNYDSMRPEDLWAFLDKTKAATGVDFVVIPHNPNLSGGLMFDMVDSDGHPITAKYARERARWELLVEATQGKGTSEIAPELAPTDEFSEFEIWRRLLIGTKSEPKPGSYVRTALMRGLEFQHSIGVNPYKLGMVGATDSHSGLSDVREDQFTGHFSADLLPEERMAGFGTHKTSNFVFPNWQLGASGRTGAWATENTRQSIFEAFKRKEVYATTGTRIALRVFGGYGFKKSDSDAKDIAAVGYKNGVPMGGDLTNAPKGKVPELLIWAAKDPLSGNLDRAQVIKGWVDESGVAKQKVYDVAWSGDRQRGPDGKVPAVGNTVDVKTAEYTNTIGAVQLSTVWADPDFKADQLAFYYVRVLEIPTPRHSLYDAIALGIDPSETGAPATIQERAYSSPIWYTPAGQ
jgi:Protein of unknown function (DUF3604)